MQKKKLRGKFFFTCEGKSGEFNVMDTKLSKYFNEEGWSTMSNAESIK